MKKEHGPDILQTSGKKTYDNTKESKIPQIAHKPTADGEEKHTKRLPKRNFVTTKRRRQYFETRSKKRR